MAGLLAFPNKITSTAPLYFRLPRSKLYVGVYAAAFTVGTIGTFTGLFHIIMGKPAA
ncbi:hypothetical protein EXIGLDRAFT_758465 [Exidia glandulosa HHB12029]|uniref:Uncharacterized protein n=1 Tax=Exidia glandulosa HHB12029 TaxID=1314781 RepID=A0A165QWK5_EXIGL|nr:hypothetical protein EXIGLDRAFT_758465 [Exidia glandulosa HHB12029]